MLIARLISAASLGLALCANAAAQTPSLPQVQPQIVLPQTNVRLNAPTRREGVFSAGGLDWRCSGNTCMSTSFVAISVAACQALAAEAGTVAAYTRGRASLSVADIAACNQNAASAAPMVIQPGVRVAGEIDRSIRVPELSFVGGAISAPLAASGPTNVIVGEVFFVGGAVSAPATATTQTMNVPELSFVGR